VCDCTVRGEKNFYCTLNDDVAEKAKEKYPVYYWPPGFWGTKDAVGITYVMIQLANENDIYPKGVCVYSGGEQSSGQTCGAGGDPLKCEEPIDKQECTDICKENFQGDVADELRECLTDAEELCKDGKLSVRETDFQITGECNQGW